MSAVLLTSSYSVVKLLIVRIELSRTSTYRKPSRRMHVELTPDESQHIRALMVKASVFGDRWPVENQLALFADTPLPEDWKEEKKDLTVLGHVIVDRK